MTCDALHIWRLLALLLPSASLLAGDKLLYRLQSTSGCRSDQNTSEMLQMQSWRPGLRCWWTVRLSVMHGTGRRKVQGWTAGYGKRLYRRKRIKWTRLWCCTWMKKLKSKDAAGMLGCMEVLDEREADHKNLSKLLQAGPWSLHKIIFFQSAVCFIQG